MPPPLTRAEIEKFRDLKKIVIVLLLLYRLDRPATEAELAAVLALNLETVRSYLRRLASLGCASHTRLGWIVTGGGRQLLLPAGSSPTAEFPTTAEFPRLNVFSSFSFFNNEESEHSEGRKRKKRLLTAEFPRLRGNSAVDPLLDRGISAVAPLLKDGNSDSGAIDPALLDAFREAGICLNRTTRQLAAQYWIFPEYVRAWHAELAGQKNLDPGRLPGLLVSILQAGDPAPSYNGHRRACLCYDCFRLHKREKSRESLCPLCGKTACTCVQQYRRADLQEPDPVASEDLLIDYL